MDWEKAPVRQVDGESNDSSDERSVNTSFRHNITKVLLWSALVVGYVLVVTVVVRLFRWMSARRLRSRIRAGEFPRLGLTDDGDILAPRAAAHVFHTNAAKGVTVTQLDSVAPAFLVAKDGQKLEHAGKPVTDTSNTDTQPAVHKESFKGGLSKDKVLGEVEEKAEEIVNMHSDDEEHSECPVCLETMEEKQLKRRLRCGHTYHAVCIESWSSKNAICPVCRTTVLPERAHSSKQIESRIETGVIRVDQMRVRDIRRLVREHRVPSDDENAVVDNHILRISRGAQVRSNQSVVNALAQATPGSSASWHSPTAPAPEQPRHRPRAGTA